MPPAAAPQRPSVGALVGVPFVAKLANPQLFSTATWARHIQRAVSSATMEQLCATQANGMAPLREEIAAYLRAHRGVACHADDVIVTTGIRHSIALVARSMVKAGDKVGVEDPGCGAVHRIFELAEAALVHAPVDAHGVDVGAIRRHDGVRLAYVTPAHQSPLGVTMSATRRLALLEWAAERDTWIIEDDYDSDFSYQALADPNSTLASAVCNGGNGASLDLVMHWYGDLLLVERESRPEKASSATHYATLVQRAMKKLQLGVSFSLEKSITYAEVQWC